MDAGRRTMNLRRPVLNELSRSSRSTSSDHSSDFILVEEEELINNSRNIYNNLSLNSSVPSLEEEIIKTRGRKKTKCSPFLRDLSPNTLATIKSPIKNARNEDLLKFLRSPTPRKCKLREDDIRPIEVKRARKSLIVDLDIGNASTNSSGKKTNSSTPTTASAKKRSGISKRTPNSKKRRSLNNSLKRTTNIKG